MAGRDLPQFTRVAMLGGVRRTICTTCYRRLLDSRSEHELADAERTHACDPAALALASAIKRKALGRDSSFGDR